MSVLGEELELRCGATLPNRIAKAAMTEAMAGVEGVPGDTLRALYARWGAGGAGMLITGNVMVDRRYLERVGNVIFDARSPLEPSRRWAEEARAGGAKLVAQLSHPGRQCNRFVNPKPVAPSAVDAVDLMMFFTRPRALTSEEIDEVVARFAGAAATARRAGFDGVQIHAAHGYLLSQFLSPLTNLREDAWGGDLERRAALVRACVAAAREAGGPGFIVGVKLNSSDFQRGGFSQEDSMQVARWLDEDGVDFIEVSGGNYESMALLGAEEGGAFSKRTRDREVYFKDYAVEVRAHVDAPIMLTGGMRRGELMREVLSEGAADIIGLGRPFATDPEIARRLIEDDSAVAPSESPPVPPPSLKTMFGVGESAWYGEQLKRMGEGKDPDLSMGWLKPSRSYLTHEIFNAVRRRYKTDIEGEPAEV